MKIAIIGAGFSGISLALHLLRMPHQNTLYLIEKEDSNWHGVAYSACCPWHVLNVRADHMGVLVDDPKGFYNWVLSRGINAHPDDFLPRRLYEEYLKHSLKKMPENACKRIFNEAIDLKESHNGLKVLFRDGFELDVDKVVIATGILTTKNLSIAINHKRYIPNIWLQSQQMLEECIANTNENSSIAIIGTGLTMVDMMTTLDKLNYQGTIEVISPHGQLPCLHMPRSSSPTKPPDAILNQHSLCKIFTEFRKELQKLSSQGKDWRQLIDSLRPHTTPLWMRLTVSDKQRFLRHMLSIWNKHRHRMAPQSGVILDKFRNEGRFFLYAGRVTQLKPAKNSIEVTYVGKGGERLFDADYVFNCTGPEYSLEKQPQQLIQNLLKRGWISQDDLHLGIKVNSKLQVCGPMMEKIYAMGSLLFGERFETTSVPDLRVHANMIASDLAVT